MRYGSLVDRAANHSWPWGWWVIVVSICCSWNVGSARGEMILPAADAWFEASNGTIKESLTVSHLCDSHNDASKSESLPTPKVNWIFAEPAENQAADSSSTSIGSSSTSGNAILNNVLDDTQLSLVAKLSVSYQLSLPLGPPFELLRPPKNPTNR